MQKSNPNTRLFTNYVNFFPTPPPLFPSFPAIETLILESPLKEGHGLSKPFFPSIQLCFAQTSRSSYSDKSDKLRVHRKKAKINGVGSPKETRENDSVLPFKTISRTAPRSVTELSPRTHNSYLGSPAAIENEISGTKLQILYKCNIKNFINDQNSLPLA